MSRGNKCDSRAVILVSRFSFLFQTKHDHQAPSFLHRASMPSWFSRQKSATLASKPRRKTREYPLLRFSRPLLPPERHQRAKRERMNFGPEDPRKVRQRVRQAQLRERPICHSDQQEACPLSRLAERAETHPKGGVPAGNEAVRGAGPGAQERDVPRALGESGSDTELRGRAASASRVGSGTLR